VDEERAAQLRKEARILFQIRNAALERVQAGDEAATPLLVAVDELIVEREMESEQALRRSTDR
jgi:hypothetical protein